MKQKNFKKSTYTLLFLSAFNGSALAYSAGGGYVSEGLQNEVDKSNGTQVAVGLHSSVRATNGTAVGRNAEVMYQAMGGTALGFDAKSYSIGALAIHNADAKGTSSIAIGNGSNTNGDNAIAIGAFSRSKSGHGIAIGGSALATGGGAISLGSNAESPTKHGVAIGLNTKVEVDTSIALGSNSIANTALGTPGYLANGNLSSVWQSTLGSLSIGDIAKNITRQITNVAAGTEDSDAVNVAQLKVVESIAKDAAKNAKDIILKGLNTLTDDDIITKHQLGDTLRITGDNKNISTATSSSNAIQVKLANDVFVNSVTMDTVSISTKGVNAGDKKVINVVAGTLSEQSTDAVNGSQLYATNQKVVKNTQSISQIQNVISSTDKRVNHLQRQVTKTRKRADAGTASVAAMASIPQVMKAGQSSIGVGLGNRGGQTALAIGFSRSSDNGKHSVKLNLGMDTQDKLTSGAGYAYYW